MVSGSQRLAKMTSVDFALRVLFCSCGTQSGLVQTRIITSGSICSEQLLHSSMYLSRNSVFMVRPESLS